MIRAMIVTAAQMACYEQSKEYIIRRFGAPDCIPVHIVASLVAGVAPLHPRWSRQPEKRWVFNGKPNAEVWAAGTGGTPPPQPDWDWVTHVGGPCCYSGRSLHSSSTPSSFWSS